MKIDFKQLAKIEKQYRWDNPICGNSLQSMVNLILSNDNTIDAANSPNFLLAFTTLKELGILKTDDSKEIQQLNS